MPVVEEEGLENNRITRDVSVSAPAETGMRKFGENPKRAGIVSGRFRLNAFWALNVSSPLEQSEKVG